VKVNREKVLNRIGDVSISPSLFAWLCDPDCFETMTITEWLGNRVEKLPPPVERRVGEVFVVMEQVIRDGKTIRGNQSGRACPRGGKEVWARAPMNKCERGMAKGEHGVVATNEALLSIYADPSRTKIPERIHLVNFRARHPHKRWPTQGPRTSVGKRESLKTLTSTSLRESRCEFPRRFRLSRYFLPPQSFISFALTEEVPKCPDAGSGCRLYNTRALSSY